jgi:hypothetical protein
LQRCHYQPLIWQVRSSPSGSRIVESLAELPPEEQLQFARLWANATGGLNFHEN